MKKMTKILPEIIFATSEHAKAKQLSRLLANGKIKKIASKIYTGNHYKSAETLIRENWRKIVAYFYKGSVISHRTAFIGGVIENDTVFVTGNITKNIKYPGLTIRMFKGKGAIQYDMQLPEKNLFMSSEPRYLLENLQTARSSKLIKKSVGSKNVELYLEKLIRNRGENVINGIRDKAKEISTLLDLKEEFKLLDNIIGALLTTKDEINLLTQVGISRSAGTPYDPDRLELFLKLSNHLRNKNTFQPQSVKKIAEIEWKNSAFYDAYFSNYIEGTDFLIEEAESIVFEGKIIKGRFSDSHDILCTYQVLNNQTDILSLPNDADTFIEMLRKRHYEIMKFRHEANPGEFKKSNNRAGNTEFVNYNLVDETLRKGFENYLQLDKGFQKAAFIMFLIAEIHPFIDGNGRVSRIFMNAEMLSAGYQRIIIPTVFREDYLLSLRKLSRNKEPDAFIKMLSTATFFTSRIDFSDLDNAKLQLEKSDAFKLPNEGKLNLNIDIKGT